jgi:sporulation protein YlmC with PRC-barrel domain
MLAVAVAIAATPGAIRTAEADESKPKRAEWRVPDGTLMSTTMVGARVKNREGRDLGEIEHLVIDPKTGSVSHVVVGLGGLAGAGETKIVLPWSAVVIGSDPSIPRRVIASVEQRAVDAAPRWTDPDSKARRDRAPSASPGTGLEPAPSPKAPGPRY